MVSAVNSSPAPAPRRAAKDNPHPNLLPQGEGTVAKGGFEMSARPQDHERARAMAADR